MNQYEELAEYIRSAEKIVVFTGAGISCASGIPDFRSENGLYKQDSGTKYAPEQIISASFFKAHTELFYEFYKKKMVYPLAKPNLAHTFFAELQDSKKVSIVTQNIDGLHQKAGSKVVFELHGSVLRNYCQECGRFYGVDTVLTSDGIPHCPVCGGIIKPDVVLYEEALDEQVIDGAIRAISDADCLLVVGTSLTVYPAAGFISYFQGKNIAIINKQPTLYDSRMGLVLNEDIIDVVKKTKGILYA